ncbi:hypothetical protein AMECASPLE_035719 [Ameca splendens]|uniref:Uncharacterized protein n=1 Tax=Ameca splendens TaxID=208324 RepID=A0ABV0YIU9_9TELE
MSVCVCLKSNRSRVAVEVLETIQLADIRVPQCPQGPSDNIPRPYCCVILHVSRRRGWALGVGTNSPQDASSPVFTRPIAVRSSPCGSSLGELRSTSAVSNPRAAQDTGIPPDQSGRSRRPSRCTQKTNPHGCPPQGSLNTPPTKFYPNHPLQTLTPFLT